MAACNKGRLNDAHVQSGSLAILTSLYSFTILIYLSSCTPDAYRYAVIKLQCNIVVEQSCD